jgi:hypothetical protein
MNPIIIVLVSLVIVSVVFIPTTTAFTTSLSNNNNHRRVSTTLFLADEVKAAPMVTGEELEMMLTEWDLPLVVDAYATWYD